MSTYEISKSSLLSLKAEILKKQEQVLKAKNSNKNKKKSLQHTPLDIKNKGVEARDQGDRIEGEEDLLKQSKSALEYKAKLYDKLSSGKQTEEDKEKCKQYLVKFDKKAVTDELSCSNSKTSEDEYYQSDEESSQNPEEKWVTYVDCFGRSRQCMQKDLKHFQLRDEELSKVVEEKRQTNDTSKVDNGISENEEKSTVQNIISKKESELLSSDMRREMLRQQWEEEEIANLNKSNIHYQDLLFGEARTHGVGYYEFSKDEEERAKQQEALKRLREETELKQKKAQDLKNTRKQMLSNRLKAARNRKRARMGLPPEEDDDGEETAMEPEIVKEKEESEIDIVEQQLEEARKNHVRPWDIGKEGVKERVVLTQNEWVEKQRQERQQEFAPPVSLRKDFRVTKTEYSEPDVAVSKSLKFSTIPKNKKRITKVDHTYKECEQDPIIQPTPIVELTEDSVAEEYVNSQKLNSKKLPNKGVEIAPPATYDYYGPTSTKVRKETVKGTNIQDAIDAGLKFLRKQVEEKEKSSKRSEDMFLF